MTSIIHNSYNISIKNYEELKNTQMWENQRELNVNTINAIVESQCNYYQKYKRFDFPGIIVIANLKGNYSYIIDGQHRLKAIEKLLKLYSHVSIFLAVQIYLCDTKARVDALYSMLNTVNTNNCMVSNGKISQSGATLKKIHSLLEAEYGSAIWDCKKINYPYVNLNILDEELNKSGYLSTKSDEEILSAIISANEDYVNLIKKDDKLYEKLKSSNHTRDKSEFLLHHKKSKAKWVSSLF